LTAKIIGFTVDFGNRIVPFGLGIVGVRLLAKLL
jgi:hypothetical protein